MRLAIGSIHGYFKAKTKVGEFRFGPHVKSPRGLVVDQFLQVELCARVTAGATQYSVI